VSEPQSSGAPQQGRSVSESNSAASSASIAAADEVDEEVGRIVRGADSGGGVRMRPLGVDEVQLPGQFAHGVEHTVAARVVQNAFPKLRRT
jgi:hypothetical protein